MITCYNGDRNVAVPLQQFVEDHRDGDEWIVLDNTQDDGVFLRGRASGDHRKSITNIMQSVTAKLLCSKYN
jgi:hypothetical protein